MATLERAILSTVTAAVTQSRPALLRHVRTPPLGASINRRQRVAGSGDEDGAAAPAKKAKTSVMWFEKAGLTTLGQRPEGPTVPYADALHFVLETDGATTVATLVSFACHPVCCGKLLAQSADYVHALRSQVETATGATAVFVTGAAGDVNPLERGGGYAAADKMGRKVGDAVAAAILAAIEAANGGGGGGGSSSAAAAAVNVSAACSVVNVPLAPLPSESEALAFLEEQTAWQADKRRSSGGGGKGAGGVFAPDALPTATVSYAERVLAATKEGKGASHGTMGVAAVALGSGIALLGIEAEPFSEYALHLSSASPFPVTITVGYANGCARYLPTQAEFRLGGYEVVHAHVCYGELQRLHPTAEHHVVRTAMGLLEQTYSAVSPPRMVLADPAVSGAPARCLLAESFEAGFSLSHDTYNSIGVSQGSRQVYYVLSCEEPDVGAKLFGVPLQQPWGAATTGFSPPPGNGAGGKKGNGKGAAPVAQQEGTCKVAVVGDLTEACDDPPSAVVQGKAHVPLVEDPSREHVWFASHVGYYTMVDGMETLPVPPVRPAHIGPYPGGCVLRLNTKTGKLSSLARLDDGEGIITQAFDFQRERIFNLSWPSGWLCIVGRDAASATGWSVLHKLDYPGRGGGESVHPRTGGYRPVCRSMAVDPRTGKCYLSNTAGDILEVDVEGGGGAAAGAPSVKPVLSGSEGLVRDYFGKYDITAPGSMGYHWRQVQWVDGHRGTGCIVGMHGNSGYLFEVSLPAPASGGRASLELVERLTSLPSRRSGLGDQFSYGYLGFEVKNGFAYYLTGAPIYGADGKRVLGKASTNKGEAKGLEHLHLVTYDLAKGAYADHGPIFYAARIGFPTYVNSIAVGGDGWVYALGNFPDGKTDLFRVRDPHFDAA